MLEADLAELYGVETGALVQAVKRNRDRFPSDGRWVAVGKPSNDGLQRPEQPVQSELELGIGSRR